MAWVMPHGLFIAVSMFQVVFLFIETAVRFLFTFITARMGQSVVKDMRIAVYEKDCGAEPESI